MLLQAVLRSGLRVWGLWHLEVVEEGAAAALVRGTNLVTYHTKRGDESLEPT